MIRTIELTICQFGTLATQSALPRPVPPRIAWPCIIVEKTRGRICTFESATVAERRLQGWR